MDLERNSQAESGAPLVAELQAEGKTLLRYLLGEPANDGMVWRYVQGVMLSDDTHPLRLASVYRRYPALLRLVDPLGRADRRLAQRFNIAVIVAEASREGCLRFYPQRSRRPSSVVAGLLWLGVVEAMLLPLRYIRLFWSSPGRKHDGAAQG